jgi:hypothetical protein
VTDQAQMQEVRRKRLAVLSSEVDATSSLLRAGFFLLYNYRFTALDAEPLFALFSAGSEKLLKLTIGLNMHDTEGTWPSRRQMRAYSHDILEMNEVVLALIEVNSMAVILRIISKNFSTRCGAMRYSPSS